LVASLWLSWQDEVSLASSAGEAIVAGPGARIVVKPLAPEIFAALERLAPPGEDEERLAELILAKGTVDSLARWYYHVEQLRKRGLIRCSLRADARPLATLCPFFHAAPQPSHATRCAPAPDKNGRAPGDANGGARVPAIVSYVFSRFAYVRREKDELVLESPLAHGRVILHDPRLLSLVGALAAPKTATELIQRADELAPGLTASDIEAFLTLLREANMVDQFAAATNGSLRAADPHADQALESWEFHDLMFHSRSRRGRSDGQFGGTCRMAHRPPPPCLKPISDRNGYVLYRPDLARLERDDPPLAHVQERRRSLRQYAAEAMTARQLGEFLYRVARVKEQWRSQAATSAGTQSIEFASRPYPAGGALHELEFYIAIKACQDLAPGLYHYDPLDHRLGWLVGMTRAVESLLTDAALSAGMDSESLQVLVILTARFGRIAWKYESIAYALTLKHVGVVYQTMYLAATAMNLAPCALGCGDSDLFARAAGTDYYVESSVGEFLLGSRVSDCST
jgi:SagB-type dehydrogenase family enzyme